VQPDASVTQVCHPFFDFVAKVMFDKIVQYMEILISIKLSINLNILKEVIMKNIFIKIIKYVLVRLVVVRVIL